MRNRDDQIHDDQHATRFPDDRDPLWYRVGQSGKAGYALLWLLGVPLPILLIVYAVRGCH